MISRCKSTFSKVGRTYGDVIAVHPHDTQSHPATHSLLGEPLGDPMAQTLDAPRRDREPVAHRPPLIPEQSHPDCDERQEERRRDPLPRIPAYPPEREHRESSRSARAGSSTASRPWSASPAI